MDFLDFIFLIFLILGPYCVYQGFHHWQVQRAIKKIPSTNLASITPGLVKISGTAQKKEILTSPFSQKKCVYYTYKIEELHHLGTGGRTNWVLLRSGQEAQSFSVSDGMRSIDLDIADAQMDIPETYQTQTRWHAVSQNILLFLPKLNLVLEDLKETNLEVKLTEQAIEDHAPLFVLGMAEKNPATGEWLIRKDPSAPYIISTKSEKDYLDSISKFLLLQIYGGVGITLAGIAYVMYRVKTLIEL